ncbi:hypothetical protein Tco_0270245 [Tanacetum coccineum]
MDHSFGSAEEVDHVRILQSCNGLCLCTGSAWPVFYYVYNRSTNLFKRLSQPNYSHYDSCFYSSGVFRMAIDPRKSLYYKVVQARRASGKYFESCGCLLLVCRVYYLRDDERVFVWSVRYLVNTEQLMNPLQEGLSIRTSVWSVCFGEGEEDAFIVINLFGKVVKYNLISKTNNEIFDIGSNQIDDDDDVEFIPPFSVDPNLYEFILSLASLAKTEEDEKMRRKHKENDYRRFLDNRSFDKSKAPAAQAGEEPPRLAKANESPGWSSSRPAGLIFQLQKRLDCSKSKTKFSCVIIVLVSAAGTKVSTVGIKVNAAERLQLLKG